MKAQERWTKMQQYHRSALWHYDRALKQLDYSKHPSSINAAQRHKNFMYYYLLLAAEVNWTSSTPKQQQQRKLASQLWRVTGVIGQLRQLKYEARSRDDYNLQAAFNFLAAYEQDLRKEMKSL